ncbi:PTS sugar transporter subunit IIB [Salinibacterium sp. TMP30]|uniref:PTS sugar transporter subunit IIB n=1 Tax=Salinibacterium sp. TMP30 TaxID=3138237 RepID=UPI003139C444
MKIVTICGAGIGSSGVLKVNAERALRALDLEATVVAADVSNVRVVAADAQIILTTQEFVEAIGKTNADIIVIVNLFDTSELKQKLEDALG